MIWKKFQKELSDQEKHKAGLEEELLVLWTECKGMKHEVEELKMLLKETRETQRIDDDLAAESDRTWNKLEDEINFQRESIDNLSSRLKKSLETNVELVSVLQELESTVEKQKIEMNKLATAKSESEKLWRQQFQESEKNLKSTTYLVEKNLAEKN